LIDPNKVHSAFRRTLSAVERFSVISEVAPLPPSVAPCLFLLWCFRGPRLVPSATPTLQPQDTVPPWAHARHLSHPDFFPQPSYSRWTLVPPRVPLPLLSPLRRPSPFVPLQPLPWLKYSSPLLTSYPVSGFWLRPFGHLSSWIPLG